MRVDSLHARGDKSMAMLAALKGLAEAHESEGRIDSSLAVFRRAVLLARSLPVTAQTATVILNMGFEQLRANQYDSALTYMERGRDMRLSLGDTAGARQTLNNIGSAHYQLGNYEPAVAAWTDALALRRAKGDTAGVTRILTNIGKTYHDWRQFERAEKVLLEAVQYGMRSPSKTTLGYALNSLGALYVDMGEFAEAREVIARSTRIYDAGQPTITKQDSLSGWSLNTSVRGTLLLREGNVRGAIPLFDSVLAVGASRGSIRGQARALTSLGDAYIVLGDISAARRVLARAIVLSRTVNQRLLLLEGLQLLASAEERGGDAAAALRHLRTANAVRDTIFDRFTAQRLAAEESREERERQLVENARLREAQARQSAVIAQQQQRAMYGLIVLLLAALLIYQLVRYNRLGKSRELELSRANSELRDALAEVKTLSGLIPICASCKRVRDDKGYWQAVESYVSRHSDATFSHSICHSCGPVLYGDAWQDAPDRTST